jgi:hypothetical protein
MQKNDVLPHKKSFGQIDQIGSDFLWLNLYIYIFIYLFIYIYDGATYSCFVKVVSYFYSEGPVGEVLRVFMISLSYSKCA